MNEAVDWIFVVELDLVCRSASRVVLRVQLLGFFPSSKILMKNKQ